MIVISMDEYYVTPYLAIHVCQSYVTWGVGGWGVGIDNRSLVRQTTVWQNIKLFLQLEYDDKDTCS